MQIFIIYFFESLSWLKSNAEVIENYLKDPDSPTEPHTIAEVSIAGHHRYRLV